jgi:hypothetical protein
VPAQWWFRSIGGLLQIAGVTDVFFGLGDARRLLGRDAWHRRWARATRIKARGALVRAGLVKPRSANVQGLTANITMTAHIGAVVIRRSEEGMDVEERLVVHAEHLSDHDRRMEELTQSIQAETTTRAAQIDAASSEIRGLVQEHQAEHVRVAGSRLRFRWWAGVFLVVGIAFTTWSAGVAHAWYWLV